MKAALGHAGRVARRCAINIARQPLCSGIAVATVAAGFCLAGGVFLAAHNLDRVAARWRKGVHMVVYLDDETTPAAARRLAQTLGELPAVERVDYVPRERALARLRTALGGHAEFLDGIEEAMLPASLEVTLTAGLKDAALAHPLVARLEHSRGVEDVELLGDWVDRATSVIWALRAAAYALAAVVAIGCAWIVAATLRLALAGRCRAAALLRRCGASEISIRGPLLLEGALHGACGATLAAVFLWALFQAAAAPAARFLGSDLASLELSFFSTGQLLAAIGIGAGWGIAGSWLATRPCVLAREPRG